MMDGEVSLNRDQTRLESGQLLSHHGASQCRPPCCLHGTATAAVCKLPRLWRSDWGGILEHVCEHGIGHPCPSSRDQIHGCDGCCLEGGHDAARRERTLGTAEPGMGADNSER